MISFMSKETSRIFSSTTIRQHQFFSAFTFFMVQLSHQYMTTGKIIALTIQTFVGKVMPLLFKNKESYYIIICCCFIAKLCLTLCDPVDCSLLGSSVHRILQARILEEFPCPSPRDLPNPGIKPRSPTLQADSLPSE